MKSTRIGVIIPAYEAADAVGDVVRGSLSHSSVSAVVVVDDGSSDDTGSAARDAGALVETHTKNLGKGAALMTGFRVASEEAWDAAITIDADGQHAPEEIPRLVEAFLATGADVVVGTRSRSRTPMPWQRRASNRLSSLMVSRLSGVRITDSQSGYRLISKRVWESLTFSRMRYDMESELLIKAGRAGFTVAEADIRTVYGTETSHFRPFTDTWRMARLFVTMYLLEE